MNLSWLFALSGRDPDDDRAELCEFRPCARKSRWLRPCRSRCHPAGRNRGQPAFRRNRRASGIPPPSRGSVELRRLLSFHRVQPYTCPCLQLPGQSRLCTAGYNAAGGFVHSGMPSDLIQIATGQRQRKSVGSKDIKTRKDPVSPRRDKCARHVSFGGRPGSFQAARPRPLRWVLRGIAAAATLLTSLAIIAGGCAYLLATTGISTGTAARRSRSRDQGLFRAWTSTPCLDRRGYRSTARNCWPSRFPTSASRRRRTVRLSSRPRRIDFGIRAPAAAFGQHPARQRPVSAMPASLPRHSARADPTGPCRLKNSDGLIDPDRISVVVFDAVHRLFEAFDVDSTHSIELDNVEIVLRGRHRYRRIARRACDALAGGSTARCNFPPISWWTGAP